MPKIEPYISRTLDRGIVQSVDPLIAPQRSVRLAINFDFEKIIGRAKLRLGSARIGAAVGATSILGLYQFVKTAGTKVLLAVTNDTTAKLYSYTTGVWTPRITTFTASLKHRFLTFLDTVAVSNGTDASQTSANGTSWVTTGGNLDAANFPKFVTMVEWQDRIYGFLANSNRLLYSSIPTGGAISWTVGNGYIDIEPDDGGGAGTAVAKIPGYLLIFKERSLKRWNGASTFPDDLVSLGTVSHESVTVARGSAYFFNQNGIYQTAGDYPTLISRPVQEFIDAIVTLANVTSTNDGDNVYFSIGTVTIDGVSYENVVLKYSILTQVWMAHSYPNSQKVWAQYLDTKSYLIFGNEIGEVIQTGTGTKDGTAVVKYALQTHEISFASTEQIYNVLLTHTKRAVGANVFVRTGDDFEEIGDIRKNTQEFRPLNKRGEKIEVRIAGQGEQVEIQGITILDAEVTTQYA